MSGCKKTSKSNGCKKASKSCGHSKHSKQISTLQDIVDAFENEYREDINSDIKKYSSRDDAKTTKEVIKRAAASIKHDGTLSSHQYRIGKKKLEDIGNDLSDRAESIESKARQNFDDLYTEVERLLSGEDGYGPLFCYDFSVRVGLAFGIKPQNVYLHSGTYKGAKILHKKGLLTITGKLKGILPREAFPEPLRSMDAHDIENILCLYQDSFAALPIQDK